MSRAYLSIHGQDESFTVHVDAVVEHKHLGPARDHVESLKAALADLGCKVEVFDELQATTHPHLVKSDVEEAPDAAPELAQPLP